VGDNEPFQSLALYQPPAVKAIGIFGQSDTKIRARTTSNTVLVGKNNENIKKIPHSAALLSG